MAVRVRGPEAVLVVAEIPSLRDDAGYVAAWVPVPTLVVYQHAWTFPSMLSSSKCAFQTIPS